MPKHRYLLFFYYLLFFSLPASLSAQQGQNPFEIKSRLPDTPADTAAVESGTSNPFDLKLPDTETDAAKTPPVADPEVVPEPVLETDTVEEVVNPFEINSTVPVAGDNTAAEEAAIEDKLKKAFSATVGGDANFLFWTILTMLFITTLLFSLYRSVIIKAYRAFSNDNFLKLIHRDQGNIVNGAYMLLYIAFIINASIFLLLVWRYFGWVQQASFPKLMLFIAAVAGVFILKHTMLKILEYAFPVSKEVKQYSFMIIIFSIILGLILVPANVLIAYAPVEMIKGVIYGTTAIVILVYLFRTVRGLFLASSFISFHKFHFFMYLCAVEIAPALLITKLLLLKAGIQ